MHSFHLIVRYAVLSNSAAIFLEWVHCRLNWPKKGVFNWFSMHCACPHASRLADGTPGKARLPGRQGAAEANTFRMRLGKLLTAKCMIDEAAHFHRKGPTWLKLDGESNRLWSRFTRKKTTKTPTYSKPRRPSGACLIQHQIITTWKPHREPYYYNSLL